MTPALELIRQDSPLYPPKLLQLREPPEQLWALGNLELLTQRMVAVVGTRNPSDYGRDIAFKAAKAFAEAGLTVVSGMALGLDARAHLGALEAEGGTTVGVLGGGVDLVSPAANADLFARVRQRGLLLSEYPPGTTPIRRHFPFRNRIIAGLADCLLVVEGTLHSGTQHTVEHMLKLGRDVHAVPGKLTEACAAGPNFVIAQGGSIYTGPGDVLYCYGLAPPPLWLNDGTSEGKLKSLRAGSRAMKAAALLHEARAEGAVRRAELHGAEASLFDLVGADPLDVDQLSLRTSLEPRLLLAALSSLELQGLITQLPGKRFVLAA